MKLIAGMMTAAAVVSMVACRESPSPVPVQPATAAPAGSPARRKMPRSQAELPTTDGALTVASFTGLYQAALETAQEHPRAPPIQLVSLLSMHAQYFGALDDYERALSEAEKLVRLNPAAAEAYLQRAAARQSLHQFAGALTDLEHARELGADADDVDVARAGVLQALGRYDQALVIRDRLAKKRATTSTLGALAQLLGEMGRTAEAESLFVDAQEAFGDVSPLPLAWLYFQAGLVEERAGRPSFARELYQAAHDRLPQYAPATGHLAALTAAAGDRVKAIALLEPTVAVSDDPEYRVQLGMLLMTSAAPRGRALIAGARNRYEALVRRQLVAFADHAARFWLGAGDDPERAFALAQENVRARPTRDAYELAIEAALAARHPEAACAAADSAARLPYPTAALRVRMSQAYSSCGHRERAAAVLAAATRQ
jgi:tetratricopeptide (TPR) repeat protein